MRTEEICAFQVGMWSISELMAPDAYLFLWATWPNIQEAFKVIRAWGFRYATCGFLWLKTNPSGNGIFFGVGHYTKSNTEPCLLAVRGRPWRAHPLSKRVSQVVIAPRREHSRKPDEVRERIVELCGDLPRLELFAREAAPGWDAYGTLEGAPTRPSRVNGGRRKVLIPKTVE
jgi:N6-adenosine-specific RNA methylase IME4